MNIYKRQYRTVRVNEKNSGDIQTDSWTDEDKYVMRVDTTKIGYYTSYQTRYVKVGEI